MFVSSVDPGDFVPFLVFAIPIIAIVGGITAGIVKTLGQQRIVELAQRERLMAIERGIDPSKLPPIPQAAGNDDLASMYLPPNEYAKRRSQNLMIAGVITLGAGVGLGLFLGLLNPDDGENVWAVGIIPATVGLALLLSAWIARPRNGG